jgi:YggT family protein
MQIIPAIYLFLQYAIGATVVAVILLMLARLLLNYADLNPFGQPVLFIRRLTDPLVNPVRRSLLQFGFGPNVAPLVTILIVILLGYFALLLAESILNTISGVLLCVQALPQQKRAVVAIIGFLLYGFLDVYALLIFIRIIFSWGGVSPYTNRVMRFLVRATDPLLVPLRNMIPPLGMFDLSPIVAFILLWLFKAAVQVVLIAGFFPRNAPVLGN